MHAAAIARLSWATNTGFSSLIHDIHRASDSRTFWKKALEMALKLTRADMGSIWALDPETDTVTIVAQRGFSTDRLKHFARAANDQAGCRLASIQGGQITIADVESDECLARYREVASAAGVRAVLTTPIVDSSSRVVGVVSTYYRVPHVPDEHELLVLRRFAELAANARAGHTAPGV